MAGPCKLQPRAKKDLEDIHAYSCRHWGEERADRYIRNIGLAFSSLAENVDAGYNYDFVRPGLRAFHLKSHTIFYRTSPSGIVIVRVLHQSRDVRRHL